MALPEEDRGPAWLRDYGSNSGHTEADNMSGWVDSDALTVDIQDLVAFADALQREHEQDFRPHLREVYDMMEQDIAPPDERFVELVEGLTHHRDMLVQTSSVLVAQDEAVIAFAEAARAISQEYGNADALSAASVTDVESNLGGPPPAGGQPETVTPEEAAATTPEEPPAEPAPAGAAPTDSTPADDGRDL